MKSECEARVASEMQGNERQRRMLAGRRRERDQAFCVASGRSRLFDADGTEDLPTCLLPLIGPSIP